MKNNYKNIIIALSTGILLFSCKALKKTEQDQNIALPSTFDQLEALESDTLFNISLLNWENFFEDENLISLINIALDNNQDNLKTLERIKIARANYRIAKVGFLPEVNGIAGASSRKFGEYTMDGVGNADSNLSPTVPEDKLIPDPYRDFVIGAQFNWELDVWGKFKNKKKAAVARLMASQDMANHVKTWLITEVASAYFTLLGLDEELKILEEYIRLQELAFNLTKELKEAGKENQLALDQFEALMLYSKGQLIERQRELRSAELYLSSLLGVYDFDHLRDGLADIDMGSKLIQIGMPSQLLVNRPDIRSSELELIAAKADLNAARAAFFPSFNLFGMAGFNAFDFGKLFFNPASTAYQLGSGLMAPIFNRNAIRMSFEAANSEQKIALLAYEQTVFKSYLEILDLVNSIDQYAKQTELKVEEVTAQKRSVDNSNVMFSVGYANYLEVTNAQRRALEAEIELVELKVKQLQTKAKLYRALGGGWNQ
ncbi:efflux transporter, outer membrane factor lipoprotein, NodT family [Belliella baltica DSM 15883]|uniref:Efflux transporter, outer membrane factor lipoprotein, NodT family n=1 Tax=Belliella baltica (strain DSM 15883 / CIP 108006 / LMG 21964 / BA134) TaxID=866536 RepID=I3Z9X5_BELBD|nr:TolC family protein [Belliella baltica]AFL86043.1 efflux transporter, outer membrane factor lipoprotein, NodT family [Belliella baltica DSM 15883]